MDAVARWAPCEEVASAMVDKEEVLARTKPLP